MLEKFGPNLSILASPSNWFLVAFSLGLLLLLCHVNIKGPLNVAE